MVALESEGVLHPVFIVALREVLASVCTARLLPGVGRGNRLHGALQEVPELKRFDEVPSNHSS